VSGSKKAVQGVGLLSFREFPCFSQSTVNLIAYCIDTGTIIAHTPSDDSAHPVFIRVIRAIRGPISVSFAVVTPAIQNRNFS
jgi:hypothetical protein